MINFLLPTIKNNYSPKVFENKFLAVFAIVIFAFNFLSFNYLPGFINRVEAGSINSDDLISLTNQARTQAGLSTLNKNSQLTEAAKAKAADMFAKGYWSHFGPNGETPWQFIRGAGYVYIYAGENLAKGFVTSSAVHDAWMNSSTHKANILKPEFRDIGIWVQDGTLSGEETTLVVQMFGSKTEVLNQPSQTTSSNKTSSKKATVVTSKKSSSTQSKDTTPPDKPIITEPINNKYTNISSLTVKGTAESGSQIYLYLNDAKNTEVTAQNSTFEFPIQGVLKLGDNLLQAESKDISGNLSLKSDPINVIYDTTLPFLTENSFKVIDKKGNLYTFTISLEDAVPLKTVTAEVGSLIVKVTKSTNNTYILDGLDYELLKDIKGISIHAEDEAGNVSDILLNGESVTSEISTYDQTFAPTEQNIITDLTSSFTNMSLRQKVNLFIALFLLILLVIDGVILFRLKGMHPLRGKSALHLPQFILVLVILIFSGLGSVT